MQLLSEGSTGGAATGGGDHTINSVETFDFWSTVLAETSAIMNTGAEDYVALPPIVNPNAGLITVTGTKKQLRRVEKYLDLLEKNLHKQVLIDVSIVGVILEENEQSGIDWSQFSLSLNSTTNGTSKFNSSSADASGSHPLPLTPGLTFANKIAIVNDAVFSMSGLMDFVNTQGDGTVISSPKVLSMNNQQALITIGDNINYRVRSTENSADNTGTVSESYDNYSIFIGVLLNITPQITDDGEIILRINPAVSNFKYQGDEGKQITPREIAPDTSEKNSLQS